MHFVKKVVLDQLYFFLTTKGMTNILFCTKSNFHFNPVRCIIVLVLVYIFFEKINSKAVTEVKVFLKLIWFCLKIKETKQKCLNHKAKQHFFG